MVMQKSVEIEKSEVKNLLASMLESGNIDAFLIPLKAPYGFAVPSLVKKKDKIALANIFTPAFYMNSASVLYALNSDGKKIGVVLRPCEIRAAVELVKLRQIKRESLLIIGVDCIGTYGIKDCVKYGIGDEISQKDAEELEKKGCKMRDSCQACTYRVLDSADIAVQWIGLAKPVVSAISKEGETALSKYQLKDLDLGDARSKEIAQQKQKAEKKRAEIYSALGEKTKSLDGWLSILSNCISCHNCMTVCPVCYCNECILDQPLTNPEGEELLSQANIRGSLKMPSDALFYHLTRLNHMAVACVECGMCELACPMDIPLGSIYPSVAEKVQKMFEYISGRDIKEPLPMTIFRENELEE
jgi:formate dehydrogenase subunit beta